MIKILITEDHVIMREGLKRVLADENDMLVVGEATNGSECIEYLRKNSCDMVLLDIAMANRDGISTLRQLRQEWPTLPVLILSMYPESQYAVRMLKAGANGYLTKESNYETLISAIRKVAAGKKYISPTVAELLAESLSENTEAPHVALSNRELQILLMIAAGKSVTVIAEELLLSAKTISTYRARILKKLCVNNTVELIHYAYVYGLASGIEQGSNSHSFTPITQINS